MKRFPNGRGAGACIHERAHPEMNAVCLIRRWSLVIYKGATMNRNVIIGIILVLGGARGHRRRAGCRTLHSDFTNVVMYARVIDRGTIVRSSRSTRAPACGGARTGRSTLSSANALASWTTRSGLASSCWQAKHSPKGRRSTSDARRCGSIVTHATTTTHPVSPTSAVHAATAPGRSSITGAT